MNWHSTPTLPAKYGLVVRTFLGHRSTNDWSRSGPVDIMFHTWVQRVVASSGTYEQRVFGCINTCCFKSTVAFKSPNSFKVVKMPAPDANDLIDPR